MKIRMLLSRILETVSILLLLSLFVGRAVSTAVHMNAVGQYEITVTNAAKEQKNKALDAAKQYNERLFAAGTNHVAEYAERMVGANTENEPSYGSANDPEYEQLLNLEGDSVIGYVEIPSISVSLPIYHYSSAEMLEKGVGHLYGTSLPVGGESTHAVLTGHRGLPGSRLFTDLDKVKIGDTFEIHVLGQTLVYRVDQIQVVLPDEIESLSINPGKDLVTLMTCTPYGVNDHRLLVQGTRTETEAAVTKAEATTGQNIYRFFTTPVITYLLGIVTLILGVIRLIWIWKPKESHNTRA